MQCVICGSTLKKRTGRGRPRKYCSVECAHVARIAAQRVRRTEAAHPGEFDRLLARGRQLQSEGESSGQ